MSGFEPIFERAAERKGGKAALKSLLPGAQGEQGGDFRHQSVTCLLLNNKIRKCLISDDLISSKHVLRRIKIKTL